MNDDKLQDAFEAWAQDHFLNPDLLRNGKDTRYAYIYMQDAYEGYCAAYATLNIEIERLKDENKALMKDRERLDWLGTWHSEYEVNYRDFGIKLVDPHSDGWALEWDMDKIFKEGNGHNYILITHNTLREAIDAARKAKP